MEIYLIIALILGTYAISAVFIYSGGPWGSLGVLRNIRAIKNFGLLECFLCTSFWIALALTLALHLPGWYILIGWGGAFLIDQVVQAYRSR